MALPFGIWDGSEAFNRAQDFEVEQEEQKFEEELSDDDVFSVRFSPGFRQIVGADSGENHCLNISKLIITSDDVGAAFTDAYLMNHDSVEKMGLVSGPYTPSQNGNTVGQQSFWDKSCFLYCLNKKPDIIICQMKQSLDEKFVFDWVDKVFNYIKPKSVILLSKVSKCSLQLDVSRDEGIDTLYQLNSDCFEMKSRIPSLPRPNLIRNLPAGVLTYSQVHSIPAVLYILASESLLFDLTAVKSFAPILKEAIFMDISKTPETRVKESLKKLSNMKVADKGVYL